MRSSELDIRKVENCIVILPQGDWTIATYEKIKLACSRLLESIGDTANLNFEIEASNLKKFDTCGARALSDLVWNLTSEGSREKLVKTRDNSFTPEHLQLFQIVWERLEKFRSSKKADKKKPYSFLERIGLLGFSTLNYFREVLSFIGQVGEGFSRIALRPKLFRHKEIVTQLEEACIKSIPVIILVTALIGIVVAYLMAIQVEKYGGHIFVVNGVALAMCRELSPIVVAVVMAGRSGSAYAAQIGAMRLNEEVDAITSIGLSPMHVLVIPRVVALVLSMPLLVFLGDIVGIAGGMIIVEAHLGLSYTTFIERLHTALPVKHFVVGMVKAPVFAAVIALIGCRRGLSTEMNARSVGISTTATVVESIVLVIILNAFFAVVFAELGI